MIRLLLVVVLIFPAVCMSGNRKDDYISFEFDLAIIKGEPKALVEASMLLVNNSPCCQQGWEMDKLSDIAEKLIRHQEKYWNVIAGLPIEKKKKIIGAFDDTFFNQTSRDYLKFREKVLNPNSSVKEILNDSELDR